MPPPLAFIALLLAKKAVGTSLYYAGKRYGWPRVYRRIIETSKKYTGGKPPAALRAMAQTSIRLPGQLGNVLKNSEVVAIAQRYITAQRASGTLIGWSLSKLFEDIMSHPDAFAAEIEKAVKSDPAVAKTSEHSSEAGDPASVSQAVDLAASSTAAGSIPTEQPPGHHMR